MSDRQKKIIFLVLVILFQTVFLWIPMEGERHNLFLSSATCTYQQYWYYLFEHLAWCYVFYLMAYEIASLRRELKILLWLSIFDFVDYLLTYNMVYFSIIGLPISFNIIQAVALVYMTLTVKSE